MPKSKGSNHQNPYSSRRPSRFQDKIRKKYSAPPEKEPHPRDKIQRIAPKHPAIQGNGVGSWLSPPGTKALHPGLRYTKNEVWQGEAT